VLCLSYHTKSQHNTRGNVSSIYSFLCQKGCRYFRCYKISYESSVYLSLAMALWWHPSIVAVSIQTFSPSSQSIHSGRDNINSVYAATESTYRSCGILNQAEKTEIYTLYHESVSLFEAYRTHTEICTESEVYSKTLLAGAVPLRKSTDWRQSGFCYLYRGTGTHVRLKDVPIDHWWMYACPLFGSVSRTKHLFFHKVSPTLGTKI